MILSLNASLKGLLRYFFAFKFCVSKIEATNILLIIIFSFPVIVKAQTNTFPSSGNVGIGTTSPSPNGKLHIANGNIFLANNLSPNAAGIFSTNTTYISDNQYLDISSGIYKAASTGTSNRLQLHYSRGLSFFNGNNVSTDASVTNTEVFRLSNNGGMSLGSTYVGTDPGAGNAIFSGSLGIGTNAPRSAFETVGIGKFSASTAGSSVFIDGSALPTTNNWSNVRLTAGSNGGSGYLKMSLDNWGGYFSWVRGSSSGDVEIMRIDATNGNVGIGTSNTQGYRLAVNGDAIFTKIKVKTYSTWPDYVFHSNYHLPSLSEVEKFIKVYNHLPDVPSADSVEKNGLDIGDDQAIFLKKIEELTLYIIEQDKKNELQQKEINDLKVQNTELQEIKKELETIKAKLKN